MALGKKIIVWDASDMAKGVSTSDSVSDAGFSTLTDQMNPTIEPGVCYIPAGATDKSTNATGDMIASTEDSTGTYTKLFLSANSSQDGQFYSIDSTGTLTTRGSADTSHNYIQGRTDFITYQSEGYATSDTTIIRWSAVGSANTFDTAFYTFNDSFAPHPALVYEDNAFYGDGNRLLRQTAAGVVPTVILTLSTGSVITALGIDPGSGKMLIGIVNQYNVSDTINSQSRVGFYDGFSNKLIRSVLMDDMITAFPTSEGQQYIAYGRNLGYWNGAGATWLRTLDLTFDNTTLAYKHHFTSIGPTLYVIQKRQILAHGPIISNGPRVFYPIYYNYVNSNNLSNIAYIGTMSSTTSQGLSIGFSTSKFYTFDVNSIATGASQTIYSNRNPLSEFNDGIWLRRVVIYWKNKVSNNVDPGSIRFINEEGDFVTSIGQSGLFDLRNTSGASSAVKEILIGGGTGCRFNDFQFELLIDTINPGLRRVEIYGDPANQTTPQS